MTRNQLSRQAELLHQQAVLATGDFEESRVTQAIKIEHDHNETKCIPEQSSVSQPAFEPADSDQMITSQTNRQIMTDTIRHQPSSEYPPKEEVITSDIIVSFCHSHSKKYLSIYYAIKVSIKQKN